MAVAIIAGGTSSGVLDPGRIVVAEPDPAKHTALSRLGVDRVASSSEALAWLCARETPHSTLAGQLLLAVKPQMLQSVAAELVGTALSSARRIVISILAGTPSTKIRALLGQSCAIVRAMPNTPARIRQSVTALSLGAGSNPGDEAFARRLFGGIGPTVIDCDESLMDVFTAVAGSGPAYVFYLAEAMIDAAIELGFAPEVADQIVRGTIAGAAALMQSDPAAPRELRIAVTSKGGTTAAAINVLDRKVVFPIIKEALTAARDRGREMAAL